MPWRAQLPVETIGYVLQERNRRWTGGWGAGTGAARWASGV